MNSWLMHVAAFRKKNPKMSYKEALQQAKKTYKPTKSTKSMKGGNIFDGRPSGSSNVDFPKIHLKVLKPMKKGGSVKGGSVKHGINPDVMKKVKKMSA